MSPQRKKLSMRNKNIAPVGNKLKKNLTGPKKEKFIKIYRVSYKKYKFTSDSGRFKTFNPRGPPRNVRHHKYFS